VLTHLLYWLLTAPVNKVWLRDEELTQGAKRFFGAAGPLNEENWTRLRDRWERSHIYRACCASSAFLLLSIATAMDG
jgi:hypothetical protein